MAQTAPGTAVGRLDLTPLNAHHLVFALSYPVLRAMQPVFLWKSDVRLELHSGGSRCVIRGGRTTATKEWARAFQIFDLLL
jgi:hypothetical protein